MITAGGLPSWAVNGLPVPVRAVELLQQLLHIAVVQRVGGIEMHGGKQTTQMFGDTRYTMHPLVRDFAAGMFQASPQKEQASTYTAFASFILTRVEDMIRMGSMASSSSPCAAACQRCAGEYWTIGT